MVMQEKENMDDLLVHSQDKDLTVHKCEFLVSVIETVILCNLTHTLFLVGM